MVGRCRPCGDLVRGVWRRRSQYGCKESAAGHRFTQHPNTRASHDPTAASGTGADNASGASPDGSDRATSAPNSDNDATASADDTTAFDPDADRPAHKRYSAGGWWRPRRGQLRWPQ
jgi:hypothetical protein